MFFSPVSSVLSSRLPLSRPVRISVQSCTISRVTSVPISTIVEIIFTSFRWLRSVSRLRETCLSLPVALHQFRHQCRGGQSQRNPSQHFPFPFFVLVVHSLRVMVFFIFRTGFRKSDLFFDPGLTPGICSVSGQGPNQAGHSQHTVHNPQHLIHLLPLFPFTR